MRHHIPTPEEAESVGKRLLQGQRVSLRRQAFIGRYYPEYVAAVKEEMAAPGRAQQVATRLLRGEAVSMRELSPLTRRYPEFFRLVKMEMKVPETAEKLYQRKPVGMREVGYAAKYHPEVMQQVLGIHESEKYYKQAAEFVQKKVSAGEIFTKRELQHVFRVGGMRWVGWLATQTPELVSEELREKVKAEELTVLMEHGTSVYWSRKFYEEIGFPEYGGLYERFHVPSGFKVKKIVAADQGLKVTFQSLEKTIVERVRPGKKGVAETLVSWFGWLKVPRVGLPLLVKTKEGWTAPKLITEEAPVSAVAGLIAPFEALTYTAIGAAREDFLSPRQKAVFKPAKRKPIFKQIELPRAPPTVVSGLFGKALSPVLGESQELEAALADPSYAKGTLFGEILLSIALAGLIKKGAKEYVQQEYIRHMEKALETGTLKWKGLPEKIIMKVTGVKPHLATQVVSVPKHHLMKHTVELGIGDWWSLGISPKTSMLWTEKAVRPTVKYLPKFLIRGTAMVRMATKQIEAAYKPLPFGYGEGFQKGLLSAPQQIGLFLEEEVAAAFPYIPSAVFYTPSKTWLPNLVAYSLISGIRTRQITRRKTTALAAPRILVKPFLSEAAVLKPKRRLKPFTVAKPKPISLSREITRLKPSVFEISEERTAAIVTPKLMQQTFQVSLQEQMQELVQQIPDFQRTIFDVPKKPKKKKRALRKRKKKKKIKSKWDYYELLYPIRTPRSMASIILNGRRKRR